MFRRYKPKHRLGTPIVTAPVDYDALVQSLKSYEMPTTLEWK